MRRTLTATVLLITGFIACPCHLPFTLPLLLVVFGGTTVGAFLATHTGWIAALSTGYFLMAIALGFWWLSRPPRRQPVGQCPPRPTMTRRSTDEAIADRQGAYR